MAKRASQNEQGAEPRTLNLRTAFVLLGLTLFVGVILKAVDDVRSARASFSAVTDREALAVAEYIGGKVDGVSLTLEHAYRSGWGARQTAQAHPDIDSVVGLADALTADEGSRARAAGETASQMLATQSRAGLSSEGDVVILYEPSNGATRIALVGAAKWVPQANGERLIGLRSDNLPNSGLERVSACKAIDTNLLACVTNRSSILSRENLLELLGYFLLLLSPGLVIFGLWQRGQKRQSERDVLEGEATKAGRLLSIVQKETSSGYWTWNDQTRQVWLSEPAAALLGVIAGGHYTSAHLLEQVHEDHVELLRRVVDTLPEREYLAQTFANKDMSLWLDMRASRDPRTNELHGVLIDVTLTRRAIQRSQQAEQRLKSSIEGFTGPFAIWDRNRRLLYWNSAFSDVFGLASSLRVGMSYETVTLAQASGIRARRGDGREGGANILRAQDNDWYKIVERMTPTGGMITVGLNVTADVQNEVQIDRQRKQLEALVIDLKTSQAQAAELTQNLKIERDRAEKSAASKSAFLANMSHELRTPLNAIIGFSEIMRDESFGPLGHEKYGEYAIDILSSGQHLLDMINDILDMAKIEAGKMTVALEPIDIVEPVDVAVRMVRRRAEEKGLQLDLVADQDLPAVDADHRAIRQMVLNLVSNAIKFTDKGGAIRVMVNRQGRDIRVAVRDSGVGIPAEALPRLAQPFEQVADTRDRNYHGTGLGLSLTKSFAELHGGRLTIASEEGKGTMVSFYLPLAHNKTATEVA